MAPRTPDSTLKAFGVVPVSSTDECLRTGRKLTATVSGASQEALYRNQKRHVNPVMHCDPVSRKRSVSSVGSERSLFSGNNSLVFSESTSTPRSRIVSTPEASPRTAERIFPSPSVITLRHPQLSAPSDKMMEWSGATGCEQLRPRRSHSASHVRQSGEHTLKELMGEKRHVQAPGQQSGLFALLSHSSEAPMRPRPVLRQKDNCKVELGENPTRIMRRMRRCTEVGHRSTLHNLDFCL